MNSSLRFESLDGAALAGCWEFKYNLQLLAFCRFLFGFAEGESNSGSQGNRIDVLARQPSVEKVRALAAVKHDTIAVYCPAALALANRALFCASNRVGAVPTIPLDSGGVNL